MATVAGKGLKTHLKILPREVRRALDVLSGQAWLSRSKWYLAGGTALGLQTGHRRSADLDFFTRSTEFRIASVLKHFSGLHWRTSIAREGTIYGELMGVRVSFIAYPFFVPRRRFNRYGNVRVLDPHDIAVMKVIAISQRGRKRDFVDLFWCAKNLEPLEDIIGKLEVQYPTVAHSYYHILKSLAYFEDAENEPMPDCFFRVSWEDVKGFFQREAASLARRLIGLKTAP